MADLTGAGEGALLNYMAGLTDSGDVAALQAIIANIESGTVAGALSVSGAITGGSTLGITGAITGAGITSSAAVQAAAGSGFVVGPSGPKIMSGTGSPESVVTAPVGSTWIDTAATTGAVKWLKATGAGNTGWVVEYGDTGLRNVSALLPAAHLALNPNAVASIRRVGSLVTLFYSTGSSPTATGLQTLTDGTTVPSGFRFDKTASGRTPTGIMLLGSSGAGSSISLYMSTTSAINSATHVSGTVVQGSISWTTGDAWPASLPGSAA